MVHDVQDKLLPLKMMYVVLALHTIRKLRDCESSPDPFPMSTKPLH